MQFVPTQPASQVQGLPGVVQAPLPQQSVSVTQASDTEAVRAAMKLILFCFFGQYLVFLFPVVWGCVVLGVVSFLPLHQRLLA